MHRSIRRSVIVLVIGAVLVGFPHVAQAAMTVRAAWNMNSLPTMVDSAGGDNNGTTSNITLSGGAYGFNGTSSYATTPDKANLDPGRAAVRLSARVSISTVPGTGQTYDIVRKGLTRSAGGYYKMELGRSSSGAAVAHCRFKDANGRVGEAYGTVNLARKGFVVVTCTKTSSAVTLTAGGQTVRSSRTLTSIANSAAVFVGGKGDNTDWFPGAMDWVKIEIG